MALSIGTGRAFHKARPDIEKAFDPRLGLNTRNNKSIQISGAGRCLLGMMLESLNVVADARYGFAAVNERWPVSQENIQGVVNSSWE